MKPYDEQLAQLRQLPKNWDGYGGITPTKAAVDIALNLQSVPCADGGIQLELHAGGADIEIEISPDGKVKNVYFGIA